jgi:DNA-binding SARP family transcriptional activator
MQVEQNIPASALVRIYLLGPLEIWKKDPSGTWKLVAKDQWKNSKPARSVFKRLLVQPGRRLSRGTIEDDLWSESDNFELTTKNVYNAISLIRGIIGKPLVTCWDAAYEIAGQTLVWTDLDACSALLKEAENRGQGRAQAVAFLEQAVALLERGALLEGEDGKWCYAFRKRAEDLFRQARMWLAASYEAQGKLWQAGEQYRAMILTDPSDEDALRHWLEMLARLGKRQEALKCYQDMKDFVEAQGFSLSNEMHKLATQVEEQSSNEAASSSPYVQDISPSMPETRITQHPLTLPIWTDIDLISSLPLAATMPSEQLSALGEPLHISDETLQLFSTLTETCRHLSEGNELRIAEQILWAYLPKMELLARLPSEHQEAAASVASQGYLLAASLVGHRNDLLKRLRYSKQALHYGKVASDLNLQLVALRQTAISFDNMDRPDKVLEVSQQALPSLERVSPLLQACIYAGMSGAYAELGQRQNCLRFMELAYEHFPEHPENEPGYLHTICRYSTLVFFDGLNRLDLGEPHEAEKILARIDGLQPKLQLPERVRIELLNYQIKVFLALKEREKASTYLGEAANAAYSLGSERHFQEAFALYRRMQKIWVYDPQVQQLADLFFR